MSFNPFVIQGPAPGNNLDTRTVRLVVMNDRAPTGKQLQEANNRFEMHKLNVRTALGGYLVRTETMPDGSRVKFISNGGMHTVQLWPAGGGQNVTRLPHGFVVKTPWRIPFIYKYRPGTDAWTIADDAVPQVMKDTTVGGYNLEVRMSPAPLVYPAIYDKQPLDLWDYGPHKAPKMGSAVYMVPALLQTIGDDGAPKFSVPGAHYLKDYAVVDAGGVQLYAMTVPGPVLTPPETPTPLPGCTDASGVAAALQLVRKAQTSETADIWTYRFCNQALTRTDRTTYAAGEYNVVDITAPLADNGIPANTTVVNNMGLTPAVTLFAIRFDSLGAWGSGSNGGVNTNGLYGSVRRPFDLSSPATDVSLQLTGSKSPGPTRIIDKTIALPSYDSIEYAKLELDLTYPETSYFRGGKSTWGATYTAAAGERGYSRERCESDRYDAQVTLSAAPDVRLDLSWTVAHLYQGSVSGTLLGALYTDTESDHKRGGDLGQFTFAIADGTPPVDPPNTTYDQYFDIWAGLDNLLPGWLSEWNAFPVPTPPPFTGSATTLDIVTTPKNQPLYCTGDYSLTSRYIIDYDHRARFMAAIRVDVQCSGARWDQKVGGYLGQLAKTSDPTYVVSIYFESNWNGVTAQQLLATATCTRAAFEFQTRFVRNIYYYPSDDTQVPFTYYMPPEISLPAEALDGLVNTALHQGVNEHLVARMVYPAVPDGMVSEAGIEYTDVTSSGDVVTVTKQNRFVDGQLYARTFKLSDADIINALWMLHPLCVDAPRDNGYPADGTEPVMWYYMPDLGNTIANTSFHIEVRNGVIEQWSDHCPPTDGTAIPAPTARDIKLYEV